MATPCTINRVYVRFSTSAPVDDDGEPILASGGLDDYYIDEDGAYVCINCEGEWDTWDKASSHLAGHSTPDQQEPETGEAPRTTQQSDELEQDDSLTEWIRRINYAVKFDGPDDHEDVRSILKQIIARSNALAVSSALRKLKDDCLTGESYDDETGEPFGGVIPQRRLDAAISAAEAGEEMQ